MSFEKLTQRTAWIPHFDFDAALELTVNWYLKQ
jgi:dTDP-D-glucose 4,6-dehydratase